MKKLIATIGIGMALVLGACGSSDVDRCLGIIYEGGDEFKAPACQSLSPGEKKEVQQQWWDNGGGEQIIEELNEVTD